VKNLNKARVQTLVSRWIFLNGSMRSKQGAKRATRIRGGKTIDQPTPCEISTIIFDLGDVLVRGSFGIEEQLSTMFKIPVDEVLSPFVGDHMERFFCGAISEDEYLSKILIDTGWCLPIDQLKRILRDNLNYIVPGMFDVLEHLSTQNELVLLSDYACEWISYIRSKHDLFRFFDYQFYSFELGR
jgi:FMN phosphatase YigB (HAD superfamily)